MYYIPTDLRACTRHEGRQAPSLPSGATPRVCTRADRHTGSRGESSRFTTHTSNTESNTIIETEQGEKVQFSITWEGKNTKEAPELTLRMEILTSKKWRKGG